MANPESNWYSWQCFAWVLNESGKAVSWKIPESRQTFLLEFQLRIVLLLCGVWGQNDEINLLVAGNSNGKPRIQLILLTILAWVLNESGKAVSWKSPESRQTCLLEFELVIVRLLHGVFTETRRMETHVVSGAEGNWGYQDLKVLKLPEAK